MEFFPNFFFFQDDRGEFGSSTLGGLSAIWKTIGSIPVRRRPPGGTFLAFPPDYAGKTLWGIITMFHGLFSHVTTSGRSNIFPCLCWDIKIMLSALLRHPAGRAIWPWVS